MINEEYKTNTKEQKKNLKKYRKSLIKIAIAGVIVVLGLTIPAGPVMDFLVKIIADVEWASFLSILAKVSLVMGGAVSFVVNAIKAHHAHKKLDELEEEKKELIEYLAKENEDNKEKNKTLEEKLEKAKKKYKELQNEKEDTLDNSNIATLNNIIEEKYKYKDEEKKKTKR